MFYMSMLPSKGGHHMKQKHMTKEMRERKKKEKELLLRDPSTFTTFKEFAIYGKAMGHKPGWAWHRAKAKGLIK